MSDFIRRVRIFLGKTPATEFLSQNTDNARAASEPSYGKEGPWTNIPRGLGLLWLSL